MLKNHTRYEASWLRSPQQDETTEDPGPLKLSRVSRPGNQGRRGMLVVVPPPIFCPFPLQLRPNISILP